MRTTITIPNPPVSVDPQTTTPIPITNAPGQPNWFTGVEIAAASGTTYTLITATGLSAPAVRNLVHAKVCAQVSGEMTLELNSAKIDSDYTNAAKNRAESILAAPRAIGPGDTITVKFRTATWVPSGSTIRAYLLVGDT